VADIEFNARQLEAIERIYAWFQAWQRGDRSKQVFFLTGYAGTGKTALARTAANKCVPNEARIEYIAPTGKAASRLRQKGCAAARTLHQFTYSVRGEDEEGDPIFAEKLALDYMPSLIVMDEASMVGEYNMDAVLRHGIPVLALGDLGQLPPVKAPYSLTPDHVDFELTDIMRQNADSNIIRAAAFARQGKILPEREYDDVKVRRGTAPLDVLIAHSGEDSQILCSYNSTRIGVNRMVREALGFKNALPAVGEKIMCTFNQHGHGFMNGEQGIILGFEDVPESEVGNNEASEVIYVRLKSLTDGKTRKVKYNPQSFSDDPEIAKEAQKSVGGFMYGYACTVHKAQGSEWPSVLVIDEPMGDVPKLRYTAYTRAMEHLTIYRR
jgi:exodeoxyribonuclease V